MIQPIQINITSGKSKANLNFNEKDGFKASFENPTPKFTMQVAEVADVFCHSESKTEEDLKKLINRYVEE